MRSLKLEQIFIRLLGGQLEFLLVFETIAGARLRETLTFPTRNQLEAIKRLAKYLAQRADVEGLASLRLRVEQRGELKDDAKLKRFFVHEFERYSEDIWD